MKTVFKLNIPIYGIRFKLCLVDNARVEWERLNGAKSGDIAAFVHQVDGGNDFSIYMEMDNISHEVIAHEVFHLTHIFMNFAMAEFEHESYAYLNGYLTAYVYKKLAECGVTVRLKTNRSKRK